MGFLIAIAGRLGLPQRVGGLLWVFVPLALLAVQTVRLEGFKVWPISVKGALQRASDAEKAEKDAKDKLAVSNASIATLEQSLAAYIGAGKAAKTAQLASIEAQAKDNAALQSQADAIRKEVAGMRASGCESPKSVREAKGL